MRKGVPGTEYVEKQTSEKNGIGQVGCFLSMVLTTIHANKTALYPTLLISHSLCICSQHASCH